LVKSISAEMEKNNLEGNFFIEIHKILVTEEILGDKIMPLRSFKEIKEIGMTKKFRPLSKITWLMMK
jgi:hypothetical protein